MTPEEKYQQALEQISMMGEPPHRLGGNWSPAIGRILGGQDMAAGRPYTLEERMAARMGWGHYGGPWAVGFTHMAMQPAGDKIHIWIITAEAQSVVLEDDAALYPSDALITKLRLMQQEQK